MADERARINPDLPDELAEIDIPEDIQKAISDMPLSKPGHKPRIFAAWEDRVIWENFNITNKQYLADFLKVSETTLRKRYNELVMKYGKKADER